MVQVKIKGLKDGVHIMAPMMSAEEFLYQIQERLKAFSNHEKAVEAFFHVPALSREQLLQLFALCNEHHVLIKGFDEPPVNKLNIRQGVVHNGQHLQLEDDTLWIGEFHTGCFVTSKGSLYVLGKVEGTIDLYHEADVLAASTLQANVRICDSGFHNLTSFAPAKVYYNQRQVILENIKEDLHGRGNSDCIR